MTTSYARRDLLTVAGVALLDTAIAGCAEAQAAPQTPAGAKANATQATDRAKTGEADAKSAQDNTIKTRKGACNCGQLRVTVTGPDPERITMCHCKLCQKQTGSAFATQARFPHEQVTIQGKSSAWKFPIEGAEPVTFRNCASTGITFHFCPTCGSTVYYIVDADPARIGIKTGTFADPTFPAPKISGFEEYKQPWALNVAALPMQHVD